MTALVRITVNGELVGACAQPNDVVSVTHDGELHYYYLDELMTAHEWECWKTFHDMVEEPATTQEFADKSPNMGELLGETPTTKELKRRIREREDLN